jgi:hypothetical protein
MGTQLFAAEAGATEERITRIFGEVRHADALRMAVHHDSLLCVCVCVCLLCMCV